jgi:hypothetical protein
MQCGFRSRSAIAGRFSLAAIALVAVLGGCSFGPKAKEFARPGAEHLEIQVLPSPLVADATRLTGELLAVEESGLLLLSGQTVLFVLAVEESGLLLLSGQTVLFVSYESITGVKFERLKNVRFPAGEPPPPETRETLRLVSRFPYGLSPEVRAALLAAYDQTEVKRW